MFFENPRRINLKIHAHAHLADQEAVQSSKNLNEAHYKSREDLYGSGGLNLETVDSERKF